MAGVLLCHAVALGAPPAAPAISSADVIAEYDIKPGGDFITLPVTIGNRRYPFMLDTGCTHWVFDTSLRGELRQRSPKGEAAPAGGGTLFELPSVAVGGMPASARSHAVCAALHDGLALAGQDIYGAVGFRFLKDRVFSIDFDRGKLLFLRRAGGGCGQEFKLHFDDAVDGPQAALLTAELPSGPERFLLDTGYCGFTAGSIAHATFERLSAQKAFLHISRTDQKAFTLKDGEFKVRSGRIESFSMGPFRHQGLVFSDMDMSCIGLGYLSRYVVTFDFPNHLLYLRPGNVYGRTEHSGLGGFAIARYEGKTIVADVVTGGAGEAAGLEFMDELVEVDKVSAAKTSIFELCRKFAIPGNREVVFERRGATMRTVVSLRDSADAASETK